ncbi:MAG: hypothetical protein BGO21_09855 [Dyadobacter sp. 50-39]|uniref:hypothetical protein n=1 Tax=Dyadobacter sp. 50-39 TaxID=1895756 RepID=UPI00095D2165|nr:hypothetical protein [Dyadobacter sp. 50-39]OJV21174.1 MAG: hypothetical protein BGO21_09855 [Dyadobacter sp. 50-39]
MKTQNADLKELREEVSTETSKNTDFENAFQALLDNPSDENLDLINLSRANFVRSADKMKDIISKLQAITWKLTDPTADDLKSVSEIIFIGRQLYQSSASIIESYQPLWHKGVIIAEINEFRDTNDHLCEVLDDIESVYFKLPHLPGFNDITHKLQSLQ